MSFKKLKIFVAIILILFIIAYAEIVILGLLSKQNIAPTQDLLLTNTTTQDIKKNLTVVNITDNTVPVNIPAPTPITPVRTRAS